MFAFVLSAASAALVLDIDYSAFGNNTSHYGNPSNGCMSDEKAVQVQNVPGDFCAPECTGLFKSKCPTDVPSGVTAEPACILKDGSSGDKYCALECQTSQQGSC